MLSLEAAEAFKASDIVTGSPTAYQSSAIYFDTPDHALKSAGVSLRIRRSGSKRIQTVKAGSSGASAIFDRQEWEKPVARDEPAVDDTPVPFAPGVSAAALLPVFNVKVERLVWLLDNEKASIELVLDRGEVIAGDRQSPVCEIEIELKRGEPRGIFILARTIAEHFPARPGVMTKADRGYGLLETARTAFKADKIHLDESITLAQACQAIITQCVRHYRLNEDSLLNARVPEALHQARVALRRLRSAITIFKPMLAGQTMTHLQSELRWLTSILGEARDLDVLVEKTPIGDLRDQLLAAQDAAYSRVEAALGAQRTRMLMLELIEWSVSGAWLSAPDAKELRDRPAADFARQALKKLRKRVRKRSASLDDLSDDERHEVRKAAKRLRYGVEFFGTLFAGDKRRRRFRKFSAALEDVQDDLGELNDLAAAPLVLDRLHLLDAEGADDLLAHRKKARIIADSQESLKALMDRKAFWS